MFVMAKRNILLPSADRQEKKFLYKGYIGPVEDRFAKTVYFNALVADGKIVLTKSKSDKELTAANEKQVIDHTADNTTAEETAEELKTQSKRQRKKN